MDLHSPALTLTALLAALVLLLCAQPGASLPILPTPSGRAPAPMKPTDVIIISEGRSGSTLFLALLAQFRESFVLFEPFHDYSPDQGPEGQLTGGMQSLLDCSYAKNLSTLNGVHWWPIHVFPGMPDDFRVRARQFALTQEDSATVYKKCTEIPFKVVKEIRFRGYIAESLPRSTPERAVKVIHLVRDPVDIALSQFIVGWSDSYNTIIQGICDSMTAALERLSSYPKEDILLVHYERVISSPIESVYEIQNFLNLTDDQITINPTQVANILMHSHDVAGDPASVWNKRMVDTRRRADIQEIFAQTCPSLLKTLYGNNEKR